MKLTLYILALSSSYIVTGVAKTEISPHFYRLEIKSDSQSYR